MPKCNHAATCSAAFLAFVLVLDRQAAAASPDELLFDLEQRVSDGSYGQIDSLLIWHDGGLLLEEYYNGYSANRLHQAWSTTKSVTSALIGVAIEDGVIDGVQSRLLDFFPGYTPANPDERKAAITIDHLLKMQSGFAWDESTVPYDSPENSANKLFFYTGDWMEYILDLPMAVGPGEKYEYSSGDSMLLSRIVSESTGMSARQYAEQTLFADLGIDTFRWDETPQGEINTGWGIWLKPRDMLKLGQLYLNDGYWQPEAGLPGKQVVPTDWVDLSIQPYVDETMPGYAGIDPWNYGYQWWLSRDEANNVSELAVNDLFFSWGYGGQFVIVVPHLDLVVATTADNYDSVSLELGIVNAGLPTYVFPAIQQLVADVDDDQDVDGADFVAWQRGESLIALSDADLRAWETYFGGDDQVQETSSIVPEPSTSLLLILVAVPLAGLVRR